MKTVIDMAREAGLYGAMTERISWESFIEAFAALVRDDEREKQRVAMQMALEDLRAVWPDSRVSITALREALAQPQDHDLLSVFAKKCALGAYKPEELADAAQLELDRSNAQPQSEWVDLTYMELLDFRNPDVAMAAISKFKEKNAPKVALRLLIEALRALDQEPNYNVSLRKCIRAAIGEQKEKNTQPVVTPDHIRDTTKMIEPPKLRRAGSFGD